MTVVSAATSTENEQFWEALVQLPAKVAKLLRVAVVQLLGLIELGMAHP
jgi:hypothetical protein